MSRQPRPTIELPESISLTITVPTPATPDKLPVQLIFHAQKRADYISIPKLTDSDGSVNFSRQEIEDQAKKLSDLFGKDYFPIHENVSKEITAIVLGPRDLEWAVKAYEHHQDKGGYPEDYPAMLQTAADKLDKLGEIEPELQLNSDPGEFSVSVRSDVHYEPEPSYEEINYEFATEGKRPPGRY